MNTVYELFWYNSMNTMTCKILCVHSWSSVTECLLKIVFFKLLAIRTIPSWNFSLAVVSDAFTQQIFYCFNLSWKRQFSLTVRFIFLRWDLSTQCWIFLLVKSKNCSALFTEGFINAFACQFCLIFFSFQIQNYYFMHLFGKQ